MNFSFISQLAGEGGDTNWFQDYWIFIVLAVALVALYVVSFMRRKKHNQQVTEVLNNLRTGDKVKTYSGFYGTIVSIKETTDGKVALLEMGEGTKKSYIEIDINAIYGVDNKQPVVYDASGAVVDTAAEPEQTESTVIVKSESKSETEKELEAEKKKSKKTK
ncbi:MAG: preprotein translocase subunit YajC [Firmicutes bacterium]|nr:preprotein translocase subunit YajC [Bacillota bacterium]